MVQAASQLTDERLRTWLDGNQPQRERLCLAILALDRRYSQIVPKRPKGGPDGGRDLEAVFDGQIEIWGAVGFRNSPRDSVADKRWIRDKLGKDIAAAKSRNSGLDHFVFLTNVDLTPTEIQYMQRQARSAGIVLCDIFYRERLRMLLDSPEGLALRYQYLGIDLSSAEQAAFFARFGNSLQGIVERRFDEVDRKLARIEFHSECLRPTRYMAISVRLIRAMRSDEIGNLLLLALAVAERKPQPHPAVCLSVATDNVRITPSSTACFQSEVSVWHGNPPERLLSGGQTETFPERDRLSFGLPIDSIANFTRVADFDLLWLHLYANQVAIDLISSIEFIVNGYVLARSKMKDLSFGPPSKDDVWLQCCLTDAQRSCILDNEDGPVGGAELPPIAFTDFSAYLPVRVDP